MSLLVYEHTGTEIHLIDSGKSGGEGTVYFIQENRLECAKIYHQQKITVELHEKILTMVNNPPDDPTWSTKKHRSIAWPRAVLYKDPKKTQFIGFTMPFIDTKVFQEVHKYYDPSDRLKNFSGDFTWRYLFTVAYNITSAIAAIHEKNHCIGDLRETNILVAPNALITLIDCDSFQIMDNDLRKVYFTRVGTGEYLPLELQSANFEKDYNRYYSDLFALGVIIFKLLMNGFHPYNAKGPLVDDARTPEAKIRKGYFPYGTKYKGVEPPDDAPPYTIIPPSIQELFYRCFVDGHKEPLKRPTAKEWFEALQTERKRLKECSANKNHCYSNHLHYCPWCKIRKETGKDHFPSPSRLGQQIALRDLTSSLKSLYKRIGYLRSYITALAEKKEYITERLRLQIPTKEIEKVILEEIRRVRAKVVSLGVGTPIHKSTDLARFQEGFTVAIGFAGGALGALFGMLGSGGAIITFLVLLVAVCYTIYSYSQNSFKDNISASFGLAFLYLILALEILGFFSGNIGWGIGLGFLFAVIYYFVTIPLLINDDDNITGGFCWSIGLILVGLAALSNYAPVAGGIICGTIASVLFAGLFSENIFDYQCSNLAISTASSNIIDFERQIVRSTAIVAGILMFLAVCAAISLIMFFVVVIIMIITVMIKQRSIKI